MSGVSRFFNYCRQNPLAVYFGGAVVLHLLRGAAVKQAYYENFYRYDVERQRELEKYLHAEQK